MYTLSAPIGVILAGGLGRRIGGAKAIADLRGRPLISYPLRALGEALADVVIVAKDDTELGDLGAVPVWIEPAEPRHPLAGILHGLALAAGRGVLVCAADMPLVTPALVARIAQADPLGAPAVVPVCGGELQPLLALYLPAAAAALEQRAAASAGRPLRDAVAAISPRLLEVGDPRPFFNVNTPEDLAEAAAALAATAPGSPYPKVKS